LVDRGVDINRTDTQRLDNGFNLAPGEQDRSLHLLNNVAADGNIALFDYLVDRGADVTLSTALHSASACEDPNLSKAMVCHLLDRYGMDINCNNDDFRDFVHDADDRGSPLCSAILDRNQVVVLELLKRGAGPNDPDMYPVSYAVAEDGYLPALEPLLSAGADAASALDLAVEAGNLEAAKICLAFGADPVRSLGKAIEQVEDTTQSVPRLMANESPSDPDYEEILEEQMMAERKSRAMVELLRSGSTGDVDA
jgi:ankyrin repeat protein